MNITTPRLDTAHPPCPPQQSAAPQTIEIPSDTSELALGDRLSLRIGLWLLLHAQRPKRERVKRERVKRERHWQREDTPAIVPGGRHLTSHEAITVLAFDLQRQLR